MAGTNQDEHVDMESHLHTCFMYTQITIRTVKLYFIHLHKEAKIDIINIKMTMRDKMPAPDKTH